MRRPLRHHPADEAPRAGTRAREHAQATVEFALALPVLVLILFAVIEFGLAFWHFQQVSAAASEGARRASVSRTAGDPAGEAIAAAKASTPSLDPGDLSVSVTYSWDVGDPVTVTVSYPEDITILGMTFFSSDLEVSRTMRVEQ